MEHENHSHYEHHESHEAHHEKKSATEKIRTNPWIISTFVLGIFAIILIITSLPAMGITGKVISEDKAAELVLGFIESQVGEQAELIDVSSEGGLYKVTLLFQGSQTPLYITKDGKNLIPSLLPLSLLVQEEEPELEVPNVGKSDKPVLEAFVSPYCPYGLQYIKGLIPVYNLLKDKADINIKYIGITHMTLEEPETMRQLCILNEYGKNELFAYLENIVYSEKAETCYNDWHSGEYARNDEHFTACMAPVIKNALNKINVDENKINSCVETKGEDYYNEAVDYSHESGVSASPTSKVNEVIVSGRSPELIKQLICSAFNEAPEECGEELSSASPSPGIGGEAGSATNAQC